MLTSRGRVLAALAVVPVVWLVIEGSAALRLAVPTDDVLHGAGGSWRADSSDNASTLLS